MRMGIISGQTAGRNQPFSVAKVKAGRNFCNKLWNIARYCEAKIGVDPGLRADPKPLTSADHWILTKLGSASKLITKALNEYRVGEAYETLYHFVWDDFADWYIEASKTTPNKGLLAYVLESSLKLAHPFAPFVCRKRPNHSLKRKAS